MNKAVGTFRIRIFKRHTPTSFVTEYRGRVEIGTWWKESRAFEGYEDALFWCRGRLREQCPRAIERLADEIVVL
jgi:hypothetical protein